MPVRRPSAEGYSDPDAIRHAQTQLDQSIDLWMTAKAEVNNAGILLYGACSGRRMALGGGCPPAHLTGTASS